MCKFHHHPLKVGVDASVSTMWFWTLLILGTGFKPAITYDDNNMKKDYICPPNFIRNSNSCYFFSTHMATWQEAHFECKDKDSELARMEKGWEDRNMRSYLNRPELARLERWIGGIYNWETKRWVWGATGRRVGYQGFSRRSPNEDPKWHCIIMDPTLMYKWSTRSCVHRKHYICEKPLQMVMVPEHPEDLRLRQRAQRRINRRRKNKQQQIQQQHTQRQQYTRQQQQTRQEQYSRHQNSLVQ